MLNMALVHLPVEYWLSYLDDILVYSTDTWDHLKHLKSIMEAHTKAGIKIQPKKTKIFQIETEYLGHKVSQGRVQMLDQYVKDKADHIPLVARSCRHSWVSRVIIEDSSQGILH